MPVGCSPIVASQIDLASGLSAVTIVCVEQEHRLAENVPVVLRQELLVVRLVLVAKSLYPVHNRFLASAQYLVLAEFALVFAPVRTVSAFLVVLAMPESRQLIFPLSQSVPKSRRL